MVIFISTMYLSVFDSMFLCTLLQFSQSSIQDVCSSWDLRSQFLSSSLRMPAPVFFLSLEFCNFWICCTLWDQTKGNVKRNWLSGRFFLLETNLWFWKSGHLEKKGCQVAHFFIFWSFVVFYMQKNKSAIFKNVNLHVVIGVDPLSACANCISNPTLSFAQAKVELEGLNQKWTLFPKSVRKYRAIYSR